jgi:DNA-binding transcriptional MerR regulator
MTSITLDTFKIIKFLKEKGFSGAQSEAIVETLQMVELDKVATKQDINELELKLLETKQDISNLELRLAARMETMRWDITKWSLPLLLGLYATILLKPFS